MGSGFGGHLAETVRWDRHASVDPVAVVTAGLGMGVPALVGVATGNLAAGLAGALGGLMIGGVPAQTTLRDQVRRLIVVLFPAVAAPASAAAIAGHGWSSDVMMIALVAVAAVLGGIGYLAEVTTSLFSLFLIIVLSIDVPQAGHGLLFVLMLAGSLWTVVLGLVLGAVARGYRNRANGQAARPGGPATRPARAPRYGEWRKSLRRIEGWQYPIRLTACLAVAVILRWLWPDHHLHWIAVTVALVSSRRIEAVPVRLTQRALGTVLGVAAASVLLLFRPPVLAFAAGIGGLAAARPILVARNYLAYSAVMTPLVIIIMDGGRPLEASVLIDRLVATLIGAGLVLVANAAAVRLAVIAPRRQTAL